MVVLPFSTAFNWLCSFHKNRCEKRINIIFAREPDSRILNSRFLYCAQDNSLTNNIPAHKQRRKRQLLPKQQLQHDDQEWRTVQKQKQNWNGALHFLHTTINIIHKVLVTKRKPIRVLCASKCPVEQNGLRYTETKMTYNWKCSSNVCISTNLQSTRNKLVFCSWSIDRFVLFLSVSLLSSLLSFQIVGAVYDIIFFFAISWEYFYSVFFLIFCFCADFKGQELNKRNKALMKSLYFYALNTHFLYAFSFNGWVWLLLAATTSFLCCGLICAWYSVLLISCGFWNVQLDWNTLTEIVN